MDKFKRVRTKETLTSQHIQSLRDLIDTKPTSYKQRIVVKAGNKLQFRPAEEL
jgi:hypothetical protein